MNSKAMTGYENLERKVGSEKAALLIRYMDEILEYNKHINLTAIRDREDFIIKNLLDSASLLDLPEVEKARNIIDIGTGAGFPGVPLGILFPDKEIVLMDSVRKKLNVIDAIAVKMNLSNIRILHARAEDAGRDAAYRDQFDLAVSRAVASLDVLTEWCMPFVRKEGAFIAMKGEKAEEELENASAAIRKLSGKTDRMEEIHLPGSGADQHKLIVIRKTAGTPALYPRKAGIARKEPIRDGKK